MECAEAKLSKSSSNISEIVSRFAKVCKLRSIGVFSSDNTNHHNQRCHPYHPNTDDAPIGEESSDATTEEGECNTEKIHPQPVVVSSEGSVCGDPEILKLLDTISALKFAYVQLQEAHIPYDPDKIVAADELVMAELEVLCKMKRAYKEKKLTKVKLDSSHCDLLRAEIDAKERLLEKLKYENLDRDSGIVRLRQELQDLDVQNMELVEKFRQEQMATKNVIVLSIGMLEESFKKASKSIHDFAKPLISLMKFSGWDLDLAANSVECSVVYSRRSHKKYAFEAYISRRMFYGMPLKYCNLEDIMRFDDPMDALMENPNSGFAKFCREKYLLVVHPMMEMSFFGNLDMRLFVSSGKHPRTSFYQLFVKLAKWVWVLLGIACAIDSNAKIFVVNRGSKFSDVYMESVEEETADSMVSIKEQPQLKVGFMVMPGFRVGETLVKSRVYLSK